MIEVTVKNYLDRVLTVPVTMERAAEPPGKYIVLERTGETVENMLRTATIVVQAYADSMYEAAVLCETVITEMQGITSVENVSACYLVSSYNFTDTSTKKYRYQAVFTVAYF